MLDFPVPFGPISTVSRLGLMLTWRKHLKFSRVMFVIMAAHSRSPLYQQRFWMPLVPRDALTLTLSQGEREHSALAPGAGGAADRAGSVGMTAPSVRTTPSAQ